MVEKSLIVEQLGVGSLLLPDYVNRGLAANGRVKYYLTLLQTAKLRADDPAAEFSNLRKEREASRVDDPSLDTVVAGSYATAGGYFIPQARRIHARLVRDIEQIIDPLEAGDVSAPHAATYRRRLNALQAAAPSLEDDIVPREYVTTMTRARRDEHDSHHLLLMDLHKALHRLQASVAQESINGARVYGLREFDRPLIAAFMDGLNSTAFLKFDHPGLGTNATRVDDQLILENDLGATDAHVLVMRITDHVATLTYTDIHRRRLEFFQSLFSSFDVQWEDNQQRSAKGLPESERFIMSVGHFRARNREELGRYLRYAGSRMVFLIDWNKARKRLRRFLKKRDSIDVLTWAARQDVGHRAWLQLGGEQLVYDAVERVARGSVRYGERLDDALGRSEAVAALQQILRITAEGLAQHRSERLIRDEVEAELLQRFQAAQEEVFSVAAAHAAFIFELACGVRDGLVRMPADTGDDFRERTARRAKAWEKRADELVVQARGVAQESGRSDFVARLLCEGDAAADELEEVAFLITLLPRIPGDASLHEGLVHLAELVVAAARELVKAVESTVPALRGGHRDDMQDFLEAVDAMGTIEHRADDAEREMTKRLLRDATDCRQLHLMSSLALGLEEATDALTRTVLTLRDYVLSDARAS